MKKLVVLGLLLGVLGTGVFAVGFIGTPTAGLNKGQWSAGYDYSYSTQDLDKAKTKWSDTEYDADGEIDSFDSGTDKLKTKDAKMHRHYATVGYGIADCWEITASLGIADIKTQSQWEGDDDWWGTNFDNDLAWGLGTKITLSKQDNIDWGVAAKMNWIDTQVDWKGTDDYGDGDTVNWKEKTELEAWDLVIAVGPTIDMGGWKLYGGPFYYYLDGDVTFSENWTYLADGSYDGGGKYKEKGSLEAKSNFGGFIGAEFAIAENWATDVEFSFTGDGWGAGAGIKVKF